MSFRYSVLLATAVLWACEAGAPAGDGVSVAGSAGVAIISSSEAAWGDGDGWRLEDSPRIEIGVVEGSPAYQFDRIMGAATLSDGRIAVADMGSSEVRVFDASGRHMTSMGGPGDGPGEFRQITGMQRLPDDGLAVENQRHRVQILEPGGTLRRAVTTGTVQMNVDPVAFHESPAASLLVVGWLDDGSFIGWRSTQPSLTANREFLEAEVLQHTYSRFGPDGEEEEEIVRLAGMAVHPHPMNLVLPGVFGSRTHARASGGHLVLGISGSGEVLWYRLDGELERIARLAWVRRTASEEMIERYVQASAPPLPEGLARGRTFKEELPAFSDLIVDAHGNVWLRRFEVEHAFTTMQYLRTFDVPSSWVVLDPAGRWLGDVEMPANFSALEIGEDHVLGVGRDEFGVEYVRVYGLSR
jgi:hypothetical protein